MAVEVASLELNCHKCHNSPDMQRYHGCKNPTERAQHTFRDGTKVYRCPATLIRDDVRWYVDWFADYKDGYLPFRGIKSDQPIKLMQIFSLIENFQIQQKREREQLQDKIIHAPRQERKPKR